MKNVIQEKASQISYSLAKEKDRIILDTLVDILGGDIKLTEVIPRVSKSFQKMVETYYLDDKIILQFYPVESETEDNADGVFMTFKQNYRRFDYVA